MASITTRLLIALGVAACAGQPDAHECTTGIICPEGTKCAAVQMVCITNDCGDGIVQATVGEKCDDGNIVDGDGCAADCQSTEACGDMVLNAAAGERCDDGNTTPGDGCAADCRSVEVCGNGIRDVNEVCDDMNTVPGDGCSGDCKSTEVCGNGIRDLNEKCDDGQIPGGCNPDCQGGTGCGDGAIDKDGAGNALEECDDGNTNDQDDCHSCLLNVCGDGIEQTSGARIEGCDPSPNFGETPLCNIDCTDFSCGDGKINNVAGEQCDNALNNGDDRDCTTACLVNVCGDGHRNQFGPDGSEECDDANTNQADGCSSQCTTPHCGNGVREMLEACDDGNVTNGDGCSSGCLFESCGDGVENNGEDCDPGTAFDTTLCNADCTDRACGDSKINRAAGEECDDGNTLDDDLCRPVTCKLNVCGDGNKSTTEACDDGNQNNTDGCSNGCALPSCGDGVVNGTDQCDDGNAVDTDACLPTCLRATCGDNKVQAGVEQCDNGVANNGPTRNCTATCRNNVCGDGFRDQEGSGAAQTEACDDGNMMDEMACPYGVQSCTLCSGDCDTVENLSGNVCGDGSPVSPETCDDGNAVTDASCPYGTMSCNPCNATCTGTVSRSGPFCGDGTTQGSFGEVCDDRSTAQSCGTCDSGCNQFFAPAAATGLIVVPPGGGPLDDGDHFIINDGFGHTITLEFDVDGLGVTVPNIDIDAGAGTSAAAIRTDIKNAINGPNFDIDATDAGATGILLTSEHLSALGNITIIDNVQESVFYVSGMSGGAARDCANTVACQSDDDCRSQNCNNNVCAP